MRLRAIHEIGGSWGVSLRLLPVAALLLVLAACGPRPESNPVQEGPGAVEPDTSRMTVEDAQQWIESLETAIYALVEEAEAERPEQCRTMPFGAKPCGGPRSFLVYATASTDPDALARLVEQHREVDTFLNDALGRVSDCMLEAEPPVALEGGRCVTDQP